MRQIANRMGRLEAIAFLSGAAVMVLEITGSRIMAPFLGTSVFVWTTLIGVIMASLSTGYWWGGRLADRKPDYARLAAILFLASIGIAITSVVQRPFLSWLQAASIELRLSALCATLLLFAPASVLLGMVTPYVVRLKLTAIERSGAEVGRLYAISTAGSIAGTFACGYFLLAWAGSNRILLGVALLLVVLSFVAASGLWMRQRTAGAIFLLLYAGLNEIEARDRITAGFVDMDTAYQHLQVIDGKEEGSGRPIRILKSEAANTQSAIYLDSDELLSAYLQFFELARCTDRPMRRILIIGAAGWVYPMHLARQLPEATIDVVEIDPAMAGIAERYFGLKTLPRLHRFDEDGRTFVNRAAQQSPRSYDAIFVDAFQTRVPPFQLLTLEFARNLERLLTPQGVVALNFIAAAESGHPGLAASVRRTFGEALPAIKIFRVHPEQDTHALQNLVMLASQAPLEFSPHGNGCEQQETRATLPGVHNRSAILLTDDYAPVEYLNPEN